MTIDKQALREVAEKAGRDKWQAKKINGDFCVIRRGSYEKQCGITSYQLVAEIDHKPVRDFVAMVNPATVLAMLDELEAAEHRIAELEQSKTQLNKLAIMAQMDCNVATHEMNRLNKRVAELEARTYIPQPLNIENEYQNHEYVAGWNDCRNAASVRQQTPAVCDVIAERFRQQSVEGWTPEHDDEHGDGELALAASCYAENFALFSTWQEGEPVDWSDAPQPANWPWSSEWWKPSSPRRDLVKAGALILAEIERGDRAFATQLTPVRENDG
ncbi:ead/Ea22-like family protein [Salmonella enterica]|uniref:ead/Ea22-like family protein n=1 Tax=Salmonella enterica TaxID=28901 RepID=UPI000A93D5DE|nr:ead/Ea22-like family protein [Salmonella enterica]MCT6963259.1 ead/Ea22-like family protein [Salmonella enterica subsp. enterica serovar Oranienburg]MCT7007251.1 ead/Ea22-like family protein [Salmonella enterica subsp. enterica serovar Oranienburg]MCT7082676.1 ead/Ea22-like family protein [Salmonella enterica subsp. enterica serovar Oranienburg]MCT7090792.1 ead/Ea22-like family protein [Salmonella enterica subsp. enterica serovar Oranienburg]MCT7119766.1 ead/Ea22-like family protein [Salmon